MGHNIIGYDLPALKKLYQWEYKGLVLDTLIMSRLANPVRALHPKCPTKIWDAHNEKEKIVGPHTLLNLSYICNNGNIKGDFGQEQTWNHYSEEMLEYCKQDVIVNIDIFNYLSNKELKIFSQESIELEMRIAKYLQRQQETGWLFDITKAVELETELFEQQLLLEQEVTKTFKPLVKAVRVVQPRVKADGTLSSVGLKFLGDKFESLIPIPNTKKEEGKSIQYLSGSFTKIEWPSFNLGSRQQIAEQLLHRGWKPKALTPKGFPVVDEQILEGLRGKFKEVEMLADYFLISKRLSMVQSWIEKYDERTGRIHGYVNTLGAVTNRMTHSGPNLAQVPATKVDKKTHEILWGFKGKYGADCRSLFTVPSGYTQVGCDASGLELRCLAHYMNDSEYTDQILNGDIHTCNQHNAGLEARDQAKTFIYAFLYGAGDAKIGSIVGGTSRDGKLLKEKFLNNTPALKKLRENVLKAAERGWLKGIDGRKIWVRSAHAALNSLLQSAGAIAMKVWLDILVTELDKTNIDYKLNGNIHDEGQFEVLTEDVSRFKQLALDAMVKAGEHLKFRCPLAGDVKVGRNWAETH